MFVFILHWAGVMQNTNMMIEAVDKTIQAK